MSQKARYYYFLLPFILALTMLLAIRAVSATYVNNPGVVQSPESVAASLRPDVFFVHTTTSANIVLNWSYLDHPLLNNQPDAVVIVAPNWNPSGFGGVYYDKAFGVWYDSSVNKWAIFNQDGSAMAADLKFNVMIPAPATPSFTHTAVASSITSNRTVLDHPALNDNPDAKILVTPNFNPSGSVFGVYNDRHTGVWYDGSRWTIFNQNLEGMPEGAAFNVAIVSGRPAAFVHEAQTDTITNNWTELSQALLNGNPDALAFFTPNWSSASGSVYNDHATGVYYRSSTQRWAIFNQDLAGMPEGALFNVYVAPQDEVAYTHRAITDTITSNWTTMDQPLFRGDPNRIIQATANYNPGGATPGVYNDHNIGLWYDGLAAEQWAVFNQDLAAMPENAAFNIYAPPASLRSFVHTAVTSTITLHRTAIDHPLINSDPDAILIVTPNWNPGEMNEVYNDHAIGVWYNSGQWEIFNQDLAGMPLNASFNVFVATDLANSFIYTATASSITSNWAVIDHPLLNDNPAAVVLVTPNYNPSGATGIYNDHPIGVWYSPSLQKWAVFNQDLAAMPENASFNVLVVGNQTYLPLLTRP